MTWWVVVSLAMSMMTVLQGIRVVYGVGAAEVLQVRRQVNGGLYGDSVVSAVDGEGVVGAACERLVERRGR